MLDELAPRLASAAWSRWLETPGNDAVLLTRHELGLLMEALLHLSRRAETGEVAPRQAEGSESPIDRFVESALHLVEKDVVIDAGQY